MLYHHVCQYFSFLMILFHFNWSRQSKVISDRTKHTPATLTWFSAGIREKCLTWNSHGLCSDQCRVRRSKYCESNFIPSCLPIFQPPHGIFSFQLKSSVKSYYRPYQAYPGNSNLIFSWNQRKMLNLKLACSLFRSM